MPTKNSCPNSARSWFCVLNNPQNIFGNIEPKEMVNKAIELWCSEKPTRSCGVNYEIGDNGTPHMHMVLEDSNKVRFTTIQNLYKGIHIEITRGNSKQALDYLYKREQFEEKNHTVIVDAVIRGEIHSNNQGKRSDLMLAETLLSQGLTPDEILEEHFSLRRYEKMIRAHYIQKRKKEIPIERKVEVIYHVGESETGKSYCYQECCKKYGENEVFKVDGYDNGFLDGYSFEKVLILDEFRGQMPFSKLLTMLHGYKSTFHARYNNVVGAWTEVHITSIKPPEKIYENMVEHAERNSEPFQQLKRRITEVKYHYFDENGKRQTFSQCGREYIDYATLKELAHSDEDGFMSIEYATEKLPFDD